MRSSALIAVSTCVVLCCATKVSAGVVWDTVVFRDDFDACPGPPDPEKWIVNRPGESWWTQGRTHFPDPLSTTGSFPRVERVQNGDEEIGVCVIEHHHYNPWDSLDDDETVPRTFLGGEIHMVQKFDPNRSYRIEARVRSHTYPNGLVTSFFTYGFDGCNSDEIDFEFLSNQTNDGTTYPDGDPVLTNTWNESFQKPEYVMAKALDLSKWNTFWIYWYPEPNANCHDGGCVEWWWLDPLNGETLLRTETDAFFVPDEPMAMYFNFWAPCYTSWSPDCDPWDDAADQDLQPVNTPEENEVYRYEIDYVEVRSSLCEASTTCSGHGSCNQQGECNCDPGYAGVACDQCAPDHYNYPTCTFCEASTTCSAHGTCDPPLGLWCNCDPGYAGVACDQCAPDHYNYPTCAFCEASTTCAGHGTCNPIGGCDCDPGFAGAVCDGCAPDHYNYPTCTFCHASTTCSGHGTCNSVVDRNPRQLQANVIEEPGNPGVPAIELKWKDNAELSPNWWDGFEIDIGREDLDGNIAWVYDPVPPPPDFPDIPTIGVVDYTYIHQGAGIDNGQRNYYRVRAYKGNPRTYSEYTNIADATPGTGVERPSQARIIELTNHFEDPFKVSLRWEEGTPGEFWIIYYVERQLHTEEVPFDPEGPWERIGSKTFEEGKEYFDPNHNDLGVLPVQGNFFCPGYWYVYRVIVENTAGESEPSEPAVIWTAHERICPPDTEPPTLIPTDGRCDCDTGFIGAACDQCALDRYNYPTCTFCEASTTCSGHGTCNSVGDCDCQEGYTAADGDLDGNCNVDLADFKRFSNCLNGPGSPPAGDCVVAADLDGDGDVDLRDFRLLQQGFSGPIEP